MPTIQERLQAIYARRRMQQQLAAQSASRERRNQTQVSGQPRDMPRITPTQMRTAIKGKSAFANRKEQPRQLKSSRQISPPPKRTWWQLAKRILALKKGIEHLKDVKTIAEMKGGTESLEYRRDRITSGETKIDFTPTVEIQRSLSRSGYLKPKLITKERDPFFKSLFRRKR